MRKTKNTVLSAMISGVSVVVQLLGTVINSLDLTASALSGISNLIIREELGLTYSILSYFTVSILSGLLIPDKLIAISYICFFGIYPIVKRDAEKLGKIWAWLIKLIAFNLLFSVIIYVGAFVLMLDDPLFNFAVLPYLLGNVAFVMYDIALSLFYTLYIRKYRKRLFGNWVRR